MATIAIDARIMNSSTGRYVERLVHYLEKIDHTNHYVVLMRKKDLDYYKPVNQNFKVVEADFDDYSLDEQIGLLKLLNELKPDLVHFCMPQQPILYRGAHVTTVHDMILLKTYNSDKNYLKFKFKQLIGRYVFNSIGRSSARVMCPTKFTANEFAQFTRTPMEKITVTYEAAEVQSHDSEPYEPLVGAEYLLYVGSQSDYKNIRRLMQAHHILRKTRPELQLVLVGKLSGKNGAPLLQNKVWAETQHMSGILYTDFVPDAQLTWLYQHCQAYVFPSLMEGFGLPGLEAMTCGAPVISSSATCLPEVYGKAAEYFDPLNVDDMAAAIERVLSNPKRRQELIEAGKKQAKLYSWQKMAEQTLAVYRQSLDT
jgi:glycosyltransferase involved in cell wall biosynthesis